MKYSGSDPLPFLLRGVYEYFITPTNVVCGSMVHTLVLILYFIVNEVWVPRKDEATSTPREGAEVSSRDSRGTYSIPTRSPREERIHAATGFQHKHCAGVP